MDGVACRVCVARVCVGLPMLVLVRRLCCVYVMFVCFSHCSVVYILSVLSRVSKFIFY